MASALEDKDILALAQRVNFEHWNQSQCPGYFSGGIRIKTSSGELIEHLEPINGRAAGCALTADAVCQKLNANMLAGTNQSRYGEVWRSMARDNGIAHCGNVRTIKQHIKRTRIIDHVDDSRRLQGKLTQL